MQLHFHTWFIRKCSHSILFNFRITEHTDVFLSKGCSACCLYFFFLAIVLSTKIFPFFFIWNSVVYRFNDTLRLNVNKPLNSKSYLPYPLSPCSYAHSKHSHINAFWYHHFTDYAVPVKALHIGGVNWRSNHVTNETF